MREFKKILFLGSGEYSLKNMTRLREILDKALSYLGGLQQPGHPETEEQWEQEQNERISIQEEIDDMARDIVMALTGKEFKFIECGDVVEENGEYKDYWCGSCQECYRFAEEIANFRRLSDKSIDRREYLENARKIAERYEK